MNIKKEHIGKNYYCFKTLNAANEYLRLNRIKEIVIIYNDIRGYM